MRPHPTPLKPRKLGALNTGVALCLVAGLGACSSFKPVGVPSHPWAGFVGGQGTLCAVNDKCSQSEAVGAIAKAQVYCMELRETYERGGHVSAGQRLFVGVLGTLSGSVFAATAGGTAAKAWAGLSGATNGIQTQIDQSSARPGANALIVGSVAEAELEFANTVKAALATTGDERWNLAVNAALLQPGRCSSAVGRAVQRQQEGNDAAAKTTQQAAAAAAQAAAAAASTPAPAASQPG